MQNNSNRFPLHHHFPPTTWNVLVCCHFLDEGWGTRCEMWRVPINQINPSACVQVPINQGGGNSLRDVVCKRKICVVLDFSSAVSFHDSLFFFEPFFRVSGNLTFLTDLFLVQDVRFVSVTHCFSVPCEFFDWGVSWVQGTLLFLCVSTCFRKCWRMFGDSCWQYTWHCGQSWQGWNSLGLLSSLGSKCHQWSCEGAQHLSGVQCDGWKSGPKIIRWWKTLSEILTHKQTKEDAVKVYKNKSFSFSFWPEFLKYKNFPHGSFLSHQWAYVVHF